MRWATYTSGSKGEGSRVGLVDGDELRGLDASYTLLGLLEAGGDALAVAAERARDHPAEVVRLDAVRLLPPVPRPPSVRDFMAFESHVVTAMGALGREVDPVWYEQPVFY
ncbi:MAG TPA: hypothetical protein VHM65_01785, partial [Candidatus Lustribacter sp.]|nr:hypothetical protein [Candidatus Lustribacter sp.]